MPTALVPRVQIRGVARQGLQPDLAACARDELLDLRPAVDRRAIPDHQQPLTRHASRCMRNSMQCSPLSDSCRARV